MMKSSFPAWAAVDAAGAIHNNVANFSWLSYSKLSIIRPGLSRLLEFEKKYSIGRLIESFSKYPDQVI